MLIFSYIVAYPRIGIYRKSKNANSRDVGNSGDCNYFRLHSGLEIRYLYVGTIGILDRLIFLM